MKRFGILTAVLLFAGAGVWWYAAVGERAVAPSENEPETSPEEASAPEEPADVRGRVVDANRDPVAGATVSVGGEEVDTDENGEFAVRGRRPGTYDVDVRADGFASPGPKALRMISVEVPESDDERPAELTLTLRRPATLSGRVVADGEPVAGISVTLYYKYAEGFRRGLEPFTLSGEAETDEAGRFEMTDVAPGRLHVIAEATDHAPKQTSELLVEPGETIEDLVIDLAPQGLLSGSVSSADGGRPLEATVELSGAQLPTDRTQTATSEGEFRFATLPAGTYRLDVRAPGHRAKTLRGLRVAEETPTRHDIALDPGEGLFGRVLDIDGEPVKGAFVRFTGGDDQMNWTRTDGAGSFQWKEATDGVWSVHAFSPRHASSQETEARPGRSTTIRLGTGGEIEGRVVNGAGDPVPGADIGIGAMLVDGPRPYGNRGAGRIEVDNQDGAFSFGPLRPGTYELKARADGYASSSAPSVTVRSGRTAGPITVVLGRGGTVTGRILSADGDRPLAGAKVSVFDMTSPFEPRSTTTDKQGQFRLEKVPAGRRSLRIEHDGHLPRVLSGLQIPEGGTATREVTVHKKKKGEQFGFRGIGASLRKTDRGAAITNIIPGGGAEEQGLEPGDVIHTVDGRSVRDMPLPKIVQTIRGRAGEPVTLNVERDGRGRFDVEITRGRVVVEGRN